MLVFCKAKNEWGKDCRIPLVKVDLCGNQHLYTCIIHSFIHKRYQSRKKEKTHASKAFTVDREWRGRK